MNAIGLSPSGTTLAASAESLGAISLNDHPRQTRPTELCSAMRLNTGRSRQDVHGRWRGSVRWHQWLHIAIRTGIILSKTAGMIMTSRQRLTRDAS